MPAAVKPFVLLAKLFLKSTEAKGKEAPPLQVVAEYESKQEQCQSYILLQPQDKYTGEHELLVFEVYDSKDYLINHHATSDAYKALQGVVKAEDTRVKPAQLNFFASKAGFLTRDSVPEVPLSQQFFWVAHFTAKAGKRDELMEVMTKHTGNVERLEDETLSFLVLESADDDVTISIFERYNSEEYFQNVHRKSESMQEFIKNFGPLTENRVAVGYTASVGFVDKKEGLV